jgi:hypothetical protein
MAVTITNLKKFLKDKFEENPKGSNRYILTDKKLSDAYVMNYLKQSFLNK